ncbi:hypothetical protein DPMN_090603 [Dreissena polymorpha]|uniref:Uncharacterized protein n=1 Tax=Dreissena polymorpha TaxID=45954 RepID=A0A9D4KYX6_DREPO|nr:hypothetical protein DPMN_090603 [Dreissena polymorpha]
MKSQNGYLGPESECSHRMVALDQTLNAASHRIVTWNLTLMQSRNGNLGPDSECSHRMVTWNLTLNAVT